MTTKKILELIEALQNIQKANPPGSPAWEEASEALAPLFAEMAKREPSQ